MEVRKGKTKSGFEFAVKEENLDDYRILRELAEVSDGNSGKMVKVIQMILGKDQEERLMEHVASQNDGRVTASGMMAEINEIFELLKAKN